jgi:hypothetical protein
VLERVKAMMGTAAWQNRVSKLTIPWWYDREEVANDRNRGRPKRPPGGQMEEWEQAAGTGEMRSRRRPKYERPVGLEA